MNRERQREVTIHACVHTHIQLVRSTVEIPCNNNIRISREGERERERELKIHSVTKKKISRLLHKTILSQNIAPWEVFV
jgi:hypothetical protein